MSGKKLGREFALARFGVVAGIEVCALLVCFAPLYRLSEQWQRDCAIVGAAAAGTAIIICIATLILGVVLPRRTHDGAAIKLLERGIVGIYIFNVLALTVVVVRTGGPTASLYATLIPIQLSAILFLQLQQDRLLGGSSRRVALTYVVIAIAGFVGSHYTSERLRDLPFFAPDPALVDYGSVGAPWAVWLTALGMFLSFVTYALPGDERFLNRIRDWYGMNEGDGAPAPAV